MEIMGDRDKYSKERVQWYETMQKPLFDRRHEIEEMRRLAKLSLRPEQANPMKTLRSTAGFTDQIMSSSVTSTFRSSSQLNNSLIPINNGNDTIHTQNFSAQQLLATHYKQKTMKDILEEDDVPVAYLRLLSEPRQDENHHHTIVVCFPGIGCSYSIFHELAQTICQETNASVYSVCLPKRMEKISCDVSHFRLHEIIHAIRDEMLEEQLVSLHPNHKLILYGHNLGGLIAYEIARSLQRMHYPVNGLIVDSMRSPFRQTMFNYSDDPHGIDDHTIVSHETHSDHTVHSEHNQPSHSREGDGHLSMSPPPKPYYAQDFQPIRDASLLPTITSNFSSPAASVNLNKANQLPILSRANSSKLPPLSRNTSFKNASSNQYTHGHGGGLLGAALHNQHHDQSRHLQHPLSRGNSHISALSYHDEVDGNEGVTQYEQLMFDAREVLPSILYFLPDKQLQAAIFKLGGLPPILLQRRDLLRKVLPVFRHDLQLLQDYFVSPPIIPGISYVEQISIDRDEAAELLEMPPSMFKLHFPVFSIYAELDSWIQNEEVTAWSLTSNSYDHFILEEANHFHFQHESFVETILNLIRRLQAIQENDETKDNQEKKDEKKDE